MKLKILIIDDNESDVFFFKKMLSNSGISASVISYSDGITGLRALQETELDCIFLDYYMPGMDGMEILNRIREERINTPVIMLTGQQDEQMIVRLMQNGATDYLPKDKLTPESLRISIETSQRIHRLQVEKQKAEVALKISEARLEEAQNISHIGNWEVDLSENSFFLSNESQKIIEDHSLRPFINFCKRVIPEDFPILREGLHNLKNGFSIDINIRHTTLFNQTKYLNIKAYALKEEYHSLNLKKIVGTIQDITELKNALLATKKATAKNKATSIVLAMAIAIFLLSEAVLDPFIDSLTASILISLSFKGGIAMALKPIEVILEKIMVSKVSIA